MKIVEISINNTTENGSVSLEIKTIMELVTTVIITKHTVLSTARRMMKMTKLLKTQKLLLEKRKRSFCPIWINVEGPIWRVSANS